MPLDVNGPLTQYRAQIDANEAAITAVQNNVASLASVETEVMRAPSFVTQEPVALDTALQITFGVGQSVPEFNLDAAGAFTCSIAGEYLLLLRLQFGRVGAGGESLVYARALVNGVQVGDSVHARLDDGGFNIPATFEGVLPLSAGDVITVEILRSSAGNNTGGVYTEPSPLAGWAASPSALIVINKTDIVGV